MDSEAQPIGAGALAGLINGQNLIVQRLSAIQTTIQNTFPNFVSVPATSASPGTPNQVAADSSFFYICIATNSWVRVAVGTF